MGLVGRGEQGGWGDGPRPPGVRTGLVCQGMGAVFIIAIALSMILTIAACQLSGTEHISCLYLHPKESKVNAGPFLPNL